MTAIVKDISVHPNFRYHNRQVNFDQKTPAQKLLEVSAARRKASNPREFQTYIQFQDLPPSISKDPGLGFDASVLSPEALATLLRDDD